MIGTWNHFLKLFSPTPSGTRFFWGHAMDACTCRSVPAALASGRRRRNYEVDTPVGNAKRESPGKPEPATRGDWTGHGETQAESTYPRLSPRLVYSLVFLNHCYYMCGPVPVSDMVMRCGSGRREFITKYVCFTGKEGYVPCRACATCPVFASFYQHFTSKYSISLHVVITSHAIDTSFLVCRSGITDTISRAGDLQFNTSRSHSSHIFQ